uniref:Isoprenylcysteine carboxylmethyltransferase family protein n=1 Tax=candidate division WOR-3 bacterium TaxID=2052148 RepID=A0A7V3PSK8_UNCW3
MNPETFSLPARMGRLLFRVRAILGVIGFALLLYLGKPRIDTLLNSLTLIIPGLLLRFWTAGYIGPESRRRQITASRIVVDGPYRYFRHPLYLGNFALVAGFIVALHPPVLLGLGILAGFLLIYGLISRAETEFLNQSGLEPVATNFNSHYALLEWQTWVLVALGFVFTLLKLLFFRT